MNNIVFLDVDGILTYSEYDNDETANIDVSKVNLLKRILEENNAKVVISSSWRGSEKFTPNIYWVLRKVLKDNGVEVIGDCPYIPDECERESDKKIFNLEEIPDLGLKHGTGRAAEVEKYIKDNDVNRFLILDDEDWDWKDYGYEDKWIQPTWFGYGGLKEEHIKEAREIFKRQEI